MITDEKRYSPHGMGLGPDKRGNSKDRYRRKTWLLNTYGDGKKCPCVHCGAMLSRASLEADRIIPGGSYRHDNIQPACRTCNVTRGKDVTWEHQEGTNDNW